jgi:hypothetical protein
MEPASDPSVFVVDFLNSADHSRRTITGVPVTSSVRDLKQVLAKSAKGVSPDALLLIFRGAVLPDTDTLDSLGDLGPRIELVVVGLPVAPPSDPAAPEAPPPPPPRRLWHGFWIAFMIEAVVIIGTLLVLWIDPVPEGFPQPASLEVPMSVVSVVLLGVLLVSLAVLTLIDQRDDDPNLSPLENCVGMFFRPLNPFWNVNEFKAKYVVKPKPKND